MKRLLGLIVTLVLSTGALMAQPHCEDCGGGGACSIPTGDAAMYVEYVETRPLYNAPRALGSPWCGYVRRITNVSGGAIPGTACNWSADARHDYSLAQPFNADSTYILIQQRTAPTGCKEVILSASTYAPLKVIASSLTSGKELRWHPTVPNRMIAADGTTLRVIDPFADTLVKECTIPFSAKSIGEGEGNLTADGRYVLLATDDGTQAKIVDIDSSVDGQPCVGGAVMDIRGTCGGTGNQQPAHYSLSPNGAFALVFYNHPVDANCTRVYDVNLAALSMAPRLGLAQSACTSESGADGYIARTAHWDMATNPFDGNETYVVTQNKCIYETCVQDAIQMEQDPVACPAGGFQLGRLIAIRLSDGKISDLIRHHTTGNVKATAAHHVSARATARPGWITVSFQRGSPTADRFHDEVANFKLRGPTSPGRATERLAWTHTDHTNDYRSEAHAVPSPDGMRVIFASDWTWQCTSSCGTAAEDKDYVLTRQ